MDLDFLGAMRCAYPCSGIIMLITLIPYLIIQGSAFVSNCWEKGKEAECNPDGEKIFALIGCVLCVIFFFGYLYYQVCSIDESIGFSSFFCSLFRTTRKKEWQCAGQAGEQDPDERGQGRASHAEGDEGASCNNA